MEEYTVDYDYRQANVACTGDYLWPALKSLLKERVGGEARLFEVGCGNGAIAKKLLAEGFDVQGIDLSKSGIELAQQGIGNASRFHLRSVYDDLAGEFGTFPLVLSLEVVEHCYSPQSYLKRIFDLLEPGGVLFISTPYHGYLKNLAIALLNKSDLHWSPNWEGGHIKFWSVKTLSHLVESTGMEVLEVRRLGRVPWLAKSMMFVARKPVVS